MIRKSLANTQAATFCVELPDQQKHGMPTPTGTGFFVSPDGYFVTAAHVVTENQQSDGPIRKDLDKAVLMKETRLSAEPQPPVMCQAVSFSHVLPRYDFALLKVDLQKNATKAWLTGRTSFPFIGVSSRHLTDGEPVYAFGYPLSESSVRDLGTVKVGSASLCPRVTGAIVSSTLDRTQMIMSAADVQVYVLDKALNYGNSGGPIVATDTGRVHALCSRFQPLFVPQNHIKDANGKPINVMMPSLYGVVSSMENPEVMALLQKLGIPIYDE